MDTSSAQRNYFSAKHTRSVNRFIAVLECLSNGLELSAAEIRSLVEIPKATTHRILATLTQAKFLERNATTRKYTIGPELFIIGNRYLHTTGLFQAAKSVIEILSDLTNETVIVGIFNDGKVIMVMKEESKYILKLSHNVGAVMPAHSTALGKAFLSRLSELELDKLYPEEELPKLTENTIATKAELKLELAEIRETGSSFTFGEDNTEIHAVASLIRNADGKAVAAMGIATPTHRVIEGKHQEYAKLVKLGTSLVSYRLGYKRDTDSVQDIQEIVSWWEKNESDPTP